jgi:cytidylate kinase
MIVSIARELGAGGGTLGEALATSIGAALLDERWFLDQVTARYQYTSDFVARRLEEPPNLSESFIATLARSTVMSPGASALTLPDEQIIEAVRALVLEQAARGHVVVIGHGVSMLGWRPAGIRVLAILLQAGREWRIDQLARRMGIAHAEAERRIKTTDKARVRYQQHYFNANLYDCKLYDLVLNSERLGLPSVVALATQAMQTILNEREAIPERVATVGERS